MADSELAPDHVLVSTAARAQETWVLARRSLGLSPSETQEKALYLAAPDAILKTVRKAPKKAETILLVGHQPGLAAFARKAANGSVKAGSARAFDSFPTGALAVLEYDGKSWDAIDFGDAAFRSFTCPKDLV